MIPFNKSDTELLLEPRNLILKCLLLLSNNFALHRFFKGDTPYFSYFLDDVSIERQN